MVRLGDAAPRHVDLVGSALSPASRRVVVASWLLVALGAAARLEQFWFCRSLRYDEGSLALNLVERSFVRLLEPLDSMQAAPVGFLWLERLAVLCFGDGERALRLFPLICGIGALAMFRTLAMRWLAPPVALLAVALFAFNEDLIAHSNDVKQYSTDACATVAILLAASRCRDVGARGGVPLLATGVVALFFSHPACFVLAAVGAAGLAEAARARDRGEILRVAAAGGLWLLAFAGAYSVSLRVADESGLAEFWAGAFLPFPPRAAVDWRWYGYYPLRLFRDPGNMEPAVVIAALFVLGLVAVWARDRSRATVALLVVALPLLASALRLYPFKGRFLLFTVPVIALVVAGGCFAAGEFVRRRVRRARPAYARAAVGLATAVALVSTLCITAPKLAARQTRDVDMAAAMDCVAGGAREGDLVCSAFHGIPVQRYYARRLALDRRGVDLRGLPEPDSLLQLAAEPGPLHGRRAWFLLEAPVSARFEARLAELGRIERREKWVGLEVCLAQF